MVSLTTRQDEKERHEEYQYLDIIRDLINTSKPNPNRTGIDTLQKFGTTMRYTLSDNTLPLLTTKKTAIKTIIKELLWFLKGDTDNQHLLDENVKIWAGNGSREFLDSRGLNHYEENDLGPVYGFQWRHFGAQYKDRHTDYTGLGVDQIANVINTIKTNPNDRRMIVSAWNPTDLDKMALPPCHLMFQFNVEDGNLDCQMYQRSCDMGLGVPFNIASYAILTHIIAKLCNLKARHFIHVMGNYHVYVNHIDALKEQLKREPFPFPKINIKERGQKTVEDFHIDDFEIIDYQFHGLLKMKMAV